jgi:hypothetical protein
MLTCRKIAAVFVGLVTTEWSSGVHGAPLPFPVLRDGEDVSAGPAPGRSLLVRHSQADCTWVKVLVVSHLLHLVSSNNAHQIILYAYAWK